MEVWKIIFLSKWVVCRFHVNLPGCKPTKWISSGFLPARFNNVVFGSKTLIWMNDHNVSTWCLVLLATLCFIYNFRRTFTNNLRDCFVWSSLPPNCYQLFPRQPWKWKMGYLNRNELQRPVPNPRISHTLIHFLGKNPSWTQYSKKITTHPYSTPQAIPLASYVRNPLIAGW